MVAAPRKPTIVKMPSWRPSLTTCPMAQHQCRLWMPDDQVGELLGPRRCGSDERSPDETSAPGQGAVGGVLHQITSTARQVRTGRSCSSGVLFHGTAGFDQGLQSWASAARTAVASSVHRPTWRCQGSGAPVRTIVAGAAWMAPGRTRVHTGVRNDAATTRPGPGLLARRWARPTLGGGVLSTSSDGWYAGRPVGVNRRDT